MAQSIFFSWQSDTPTRIGRNFIREVLDAICKDIATDTGIDEAPRDIRVDSDTQGVAGQPPIVDTIFKKIDASSIFVADMTFVGARVDSRPIPNPNVLIEYGWALKDKTHERVLSVMNTAYGYPTGDALPFNLRHLRWPITYHLEDSASPSIKAATKAALIATLGKAIRASLSTLLPASTEPIFSFPAAEVKDAPARFRSHGEALGFEESFAFQESREVFLTEGPAMWFRVMPSVDPKRRWPAHTLREVARSPATGLVPLITGRGWSFLRAEDGIGAYRPHDDQKQKERVYGDSVAFVFETGEIWAIETAPHLYNSDHLYATQIENTYTRSLQNYAKFLQALELTFPYHWVAGIDGTKGRHLSYQAPPDRVFIGQGPKCAANLIEAAGEYDGKQTLTNALLPFFDKIFQKCGLPRPDHLPQ